MKPAALTRDLLRSMPLPEPGEGSKDSRGSVLVVAGSVEVPGAALLAAEAAMRAGAGKLQVATVRSAAAALGIAVPEAMVIGLHETADGGVDGRAAIQRLEPNMKKADAVLIGPGMAESESVAAMTRDLCEHASALVLDAAALCDLRPHAAAVRERAKALVITPHAGEMAQLLDRSRDDVEADPLGAGRAAAELLGAVVVVKGAKSHVVAPDGSAWLFEGGGVGLATSGSGDVLAGIIVGLLARGADPARATLWGVYLHGEAGRRVSARMGTIGLLARHLPAEVPRILEELSGPP